MSAGVFSAPGSKVRDLANIEAALLVFAVGERLFVRGSACSKAGQCFPTSVPQWLGLASFLAENESTPPRDALGYLCLSYSAFFFRFPWNNRRYSNMIIMPRRLR